MTQPLLAYALLCAIAAVSIGAARIVSWLLDRRDHADAQRAREVALIAQAHAEVSHGR